DKQTLTRLAWITELRRQGHRQCTNGLYFDDDMTACALAILGEVAGLTPRQISHREGSQIGALAGLKLWQSQHVVKLNDGGTDCQGGKHTCAEIADVVEDWFR